jgi:hypothetical protein
VKQLLKAAVSVSNQNNSYLPLALGSQVVAEPDNYQFLNSVSHCSFTHGPNPFKTVFLINYQQISLIKLSIYFSTQAIIILLLNIGRVLI